MFEIAREHGGLSPVQIPAVVNGDDGVGARNYMRKRKTSIKIALIPAKAIAIRFRILGY